MPLALIVHGGAWNIPQDEWDANTRGVERAAAAGWQVLREGGRALDAVEAAIVVMEDDAIFDAGIGSVLNRDGNVELDAGLMEGMSLEAGACAAVTGVKNPIRLARKILGSENTFMVGRGAERSAILQVRIGGGVAGAYASARVPWRKHPFRYHPALQDW